MIQEIDKDLTALIGDGNAKIGNSDIEYEHQWINMD